MYWRTNSPLSEKLAILAHFSHWLRWRDGCGVSSGIWVRGGMVQWGTTSPHRCSSAPSLFPSSRGCGVVRQAERPHAVKSLFRKGGLFGPTRKVFLVFLLGLRRYQRALRRSRRMSFCAHRHGSSHEGVVFQIKEEARALFKV